MLLRGSYSQAAGEPCGGRLSRTQIYIGQVNLLGKILMAVQPANQCYIVQFVRPFCIAIMYQNF